MATKKIVKKQEPKKPKVTKKKEPIVEPKKPKVTKKKEPIVEPKPPEVLSFNTMLSVNIEDLLNLKDDVKSILNLDFLGKMLLASKYENYSITKSSLSNFVVKIIGIEDNNLLTIRLSGEFTNA